MKPENRKQIIVLSLLGLVLLGAIVRALLTASTPPPPPSTAPQGPRPAVGVRPAAPANPTRLETVDVDIDELLKEIEVVTFDYATERIDRDPMAPLVGRVYRAGEPTPPGPTPPRMVVLRKNVTGIIWDEYDPVAVVDDEVVSLGHTYPDGTQVYAIERGRVVFKVGDSLIPVEMKEL